MLDDQGKPRDRRLIDAILVLGALALLFIVIGQLASVFFYFGDILLTFFLAWLLAFIISPVVTRISARHPAPAAGRRHGPRLHDRRRDPAGDPRPRRRRPGDLDRRVRRLDPAASTRTCPTILKPWQDWLDSIGLGQVDLLAQAQAILDNLDDLSARPGRSRSSRSPSPA